MTSPSPKSKTTIPILFEDAFLLAADKPSGLLTVPDRWDSKLENAHVLLQDQIQKKLFVVHRLDKDTSGIVLFAKTAQAHRHLSLQFQTRAVHKEYWALVRGVMQEDCGSWTYPIAENTRHPGVMISHRLGKPAQTDFTVLERFTKAQCSWLLLKPLTGRTHQIRLHLQCAGHPIVGDVIYGSADAMCLSDMKRGYKPKRGVSERPLLNRLALHAHGVHCKHPHADSTMQLQSPLPKDLKITLAYLRKFGA